MANTPTAVYALNKPAQGDTPWTTTVNGDWDSIDSELARPRIIYNSPVVGATTTCDLNNGRVFVFTVSQITTLAFTNVPSASFFVRMDLIITNGAAFALTFPASVSWLNGAVPVFQLAGVDIVEMVSIDAGVTWRARLLNGGYGRLGRSAATMRLSGIAYQSNSKTTTSGVDASLDSFSLPANTLAVNGQQLRLTVTGLTPVGGATINTRFGAGGFGSVTIVGTMGFTLVSTLVRTGAATQVVNYMVLGNNAVQITARGAGAETLSGAILLDFRGNATTGGQTLTYDSILVESLAS